MKKIVILCALLFSGCTISDTYWKPDIGPNNVATATGITEISSSPTQTSRANEITYFYGSCAYLFHLFRLSTHCSPDEIAMKYNLKTITEVNTHKVWIPLATLQRTFIKGIPETND